MATATSPMPNATPAAPMPIRIGAPITAMPPAPINPIPALITPPLAIAPNPPVTPFNKFPAVPGLGP